MTPKIPPGTASCGRLSHAMISAPAKVNLTLEILGIRPDGYHDLRSLLMPVSLYETLEATPCEPGRVECATRLESVPAFDMESVPCERHLAVRAARALEEAARRRDPAATEFLPGALLRIVKRVPVGAGMGGGSADAAAALRELNAIWNLSLSPEELASVGATFASDVPGMVLGGPVVMEGRGECVRRIAGPPPAAPLWLVLAFCGEPISTRDVYAACPETAMGPEGCLEQMEMAVATGCPRMAADALFNGLEATVLVRHPRTAELPGALCRAGALGAALSGSGGVVFGIAEDEAHARFIESHLPAGLWTRVVSTGAPFQTRSQADFSRGVRESC